ncbi:hypothetical protein AMK05_PB00259 (plasmid) [Rhizobium sp. N324]|nr:hypothetical protein AMK05_PB00259 [Rhizobium sp. N324]OYD01187.1 hypothetical protein AMK08_PB00257 [Rhizobium sp. N4311]
MGLANRPIHNQCCAASAGTAANALLSEPIGDQHEEVQQASSCSITELMPFCYVIT